VAAAVIWIDVTLPTNPETMVLYFIVYSAAVSSLPVPKDTHPEWYHWLYKFTNTLAANVNALRGKAQYDPKMQVTAAETSTSKVEVSQLAEPPRPPTEHGNVS